MQSRLNHAIIGTAGHIDHGKTALIKALTGVDVDTLDEEKRRGITIELGFAFMDIPQHDKEIVFIDVPGHEKLIKTMVAGASNLDAVLFVIAADEGVSVQTTEHLDILNLLGIKDGIIALTKIDIVDDDWTREVTADIRQLVADTFLADAPIIPVSSLTGEGIDDIKSALSDVAGRVSVRQDSGVFRMPVDRTFAMQGFGAVIAGTILSGEARVGDRIEILPEGLSARIRGIQVHGKPVERSVIGVRTAINLQEVKKEQIRRGQCACAPGSLVATSRIDARLYVLKGRDDEIRNRTRVRLHVGTDEVICRVTLLDSEKLGPGDTGLVQFVLEAPTTALPRDKFVIRTFSSARTLGGGSVIDSRPVRHKRFETAVLDALEKLEGGTADVVEQAYLKAGSVPQTTGDIASLIGESEDVVKETAASLEGSGKLVRIGQQKHLHCSRFAALTENLLGLINDYYTREPYRLLMPMVDLQSRFLKLADKQVMDAIIAALCDSGTLCRKDQKIGIAGRQAPLTDDERAMRQRIVEAFLRAGYATPTEEEIAESLRIRPQVFERIIVGLIDEGVLVMVGDRVTYHKDHLERARQMVIDHIRKNGSITAAELRDSLGVTRKYSIALLEYFDSIFLTRRSGDKRVLRQNI